MPSPEAKALTVAYRTGQYAIRAAALRQLLAIWPALDLDDLDGTWPAVLAGLMAVIDVHHPRSARDASDYYSEFRTLEQAAGEFVPDPAPAPERNLTRATLTLLGPIAAKKTISSNRRRVADLMFTRVAGSVGRVVLSGGRDTLQAATRDDPASQGWRRVTDGDPCRWCRKDASNGVRAATVRFPAHDHCGCTPEPVLDRR